jgi:hypothetical protein
MHRFRAQFRISLDMLPAARGETSRSPAAADENCISGRPAQQRVEPSVDYPSQRSS